MGISNFTYRLKAKSGDTSPVDELGVSGALSGGTIALVDRGSGDVAWQFSAGGAAVTVPSRTISPTVAGGGVTIAITVRVPNYGTLDYSVFMGYCSTALLSTDANTHPPGLCIGRVTANTLRATQTDASYTTPALTTDTTTDRTFVLRFGINKSGNYDRTDLWVTTASRSGTAPNQNGALVAGTSATLNTVSINANNGTVLQVKDFVIWGEELVDADCAALADGLRATLDMTNTTIAGAVGNAVAAGATAAVTQGGNTTITGLVGNAAAAGLTAAITGIGTTIGASVGNTTAAGPTSTIASYLMTEALMNNTESILANTAVVWTWTPSGRIGSMAGLTATDGSGTTDANGRLVTSVAVATGRLDVAVRGATAKADAAFQEYF